MYKLYYATGDVFYGTKDKFGEDTAYYVSSDLMEFYSTYEYFNGHTVTLYKVANGNMDTRIISESQFPD